jgi:hypothetical protein
MKPISQISRGLFAAGLAFWPVFLLLTVLDEKAGLRWLRTDDPALWVPIAVLALLGAVSAPFFSQWKISKKIAVSIGALVGFAATYGAVVLIGVSFLNWSD